MIVCVFLIIVIARTVLGAIAVGIDDNVVIRTLFDVLASTVTAPVAALVAAVIYFRLKGLEDGATPTPPVEPGPATV